MDEPTEGLMPLLVDKVLETTRTLKARGVGVLLVEQKIDAALRVADRVAVIELGRIRYEGGRDDVLSSPDVLLTYLGVRR
jgi:branched-chain amino acid transport system ATP-binding protein